jgi:hypothetical protein
MVHRSSARGRPIGAGGGKKRRIKAHCLPVRPILLMRAGYFILPVFRNRLYLCLRIEYFPLSSRQCILQSPAQCQFA